MEPTEFCGKTVEEAIEKGLMQLGVNRDDVKVTVLKERKGGILGIGAEEARILIEPLEEAPPEANDAAQIAQGITEELLRLMGLQVTVTPEKPFIGDEEEAVVPITFNITGNEDSGILIGRHGQTISNLQYIVRIILSRRMSEPPPVIVDVDGYKQRRYEALRATARRIAEQVRNRRTAFTLEPMPPIERRIIHLALADNPYVTTQSTGEGDSRKVMIIPKQQGRNSRTVNSRR